MSLGAIAERYAQALYELGVESGKLGVLSDKLRDFADTYEANAELRQALSSPLVGREAADQIITNVAKKLGVPDVGIRGLILMASRGRLVAIRETSDRLTQLCDDKEGVVRAEVTTAAQMPEAYYQELSSKLASAINKKIVLERKVDESLIGGAIARVGDSVLDASVRGRLQKFESDVLSVLSASSV